MSNLCLNLDFLATVTMVYIPTKDSDWSYTVRSEVLSKVGITSIDNFIYNISYFHNKITVTNVFPVISHQIAQTTLLLLVFIYS